MRQMVFGLLFAFVLQAQPKSPMAADELVSQRALAVSAPGAQLAAVLQFVSRYPNSPNVPMLITRGFGAAARTSSWSAGRARELAADIGERVAKGSPMARSEAARTIAQSLAAGNLALRDAEAWARQAIAGLDVEDHIARERLWHEQHYRGRGFFVEEAREKYRGIEAMNWCLLGRILIREGRDAEARQALQKSLAAARTADAASAFAGLAAKQGDTHTVLDALGTAILTGKADRPTIERFEAAYRDSGMRPDPEQWLDRRYRMESRNPLEGVPYRGPTASPRRAVLLEVVTGAACEACIAVDLATDALLHRYSRQDLVVITHHVPGAGVDPLVSAASEKRAGRYENRDAPAIFLDGEAIDPRAIDPGRGLASVAKPVFDGLDAAIQKRIAVPVNAGVRLHAKWSGEDLDVEAMVDEAEGAKLQLYLLKTEVSYSGTNGVRLHPMVTRDAARMEEGGLEVRGAAFRTQWSFPMAGSQHQGETGKLAVVAVVIDAASGRVSQSAFLAVEGTK